MISLFVKQATTIDFSFLDEARGLVGETFIIDIWLTGETNAEGMLLDFSHVKKRIKAEIDHLVDHTFVIPSKSNSITLEKIKKRDQDSAIIEWKNAEEQLYRLHSPVEAICEIPSTEISADIISHFLVNNISPKLDSNIKKLELKLYPENIEGPFYHYSHGLKKHLGDCQRIAHGHRSRIEIFKNEKLDKELSQQWANKFRDIYIGQREDINLAKTNDKNISFSYKAQQGAFELMLPKSRTHIIQKDTTIEHIAEHIYQEIAHTYPNDRFAVHAYEGFNKGAVCQSSY